MVSYRIKQSTVLVRMMTFSCLQALEAMLAATVEAAENAVALPTEAAALLDLQDILTLLSCFAQWDRKATETAAAALLSYTPALPSICRAGNAISAALNPGDTQERLQIRCNFPPLNVHWHDPSSMRISLTVSLICDDRIARTNALF